jgi:hypothetical protein
VREQIPDRDLTTRGHMETPASDRTATDVFAYAGMTWLTGLPIVRRPSSASCRIATLVSSSRDAIRKMVSGSATARLPIARADGFLVDGTTVREARRHNSGHRLSSTYFWRAPSSLAGARRRNRPPSSCRSRAAAARMRWREEDQKDVGHLR